MRNVLVFINEINLKYVLDSTCENALCIDNVERSVIRDNLLHVPRLVR